MKAVNLIPADLSASGSARPPQDVQAAVYGLLGLLGVGVGMMSLYVLDGNKIAQSRVQIAALKTESGQVQSEIGQLGNYVNFQQLAASRAQSVRQIAAGNFDWAAALGQLSRVVPANTTLQTLNATTAGSSTPGAAAAASAGASGPSFELTGCTSGQVAVAGLMSRLRLISGVTRVALNSSVKSSSSAGTPGAAPASVSGSTAGCGRLNTNFDMLVTFSAPTGSAVATSATPAGTTPAAPAAAPATPAPATTTTSTGAAR